MTARHAPGIGSRIWDQTLTLLRKQETISPHDIIQQIEELEPSDVEYVESRLQSMSETGWICKIDGTRRYKSNRIELRIPFDDESTTKRR